MSSKFDAPNLSRMIADASCNWLCYEGLEASEIGKLPLGAEFWALYAPAYNAQYYHAVLFRVAMQDDTVLKRKLRVYVAMQEIRYADNPLENKL